MERTNYEINLHVENERKLFPSPDEVMDEPATRAEVIGGCVFIAVVLILALIDLLS